MTRICGLTLLLGIFVLPLGLVHSRAAEKPPNIIFIMADDLGYGHLGCYGQKRIETPRLDRLARQGMRFTQAYAGCTVCAPSRSVLMTGLHTGHTSVRANLGGVPLLDEDITVAEVLCEAGYTSGCFGKWGLGDAETSGVPRRQGFDEFFGYLHQVHAHFYYPEYLWHNETKAPLPGNAEGRRGQYTHDEITERAMGFISRNREQPFFCYVPYTIPHVELLVPVESLARYRGKFEETPFVDSRGHYADQTHPRAAIAAMIWHLDQSVGRILDLLDELELAEKTIVFFTSDNGAQSGYGTDPDFFNACGPLHGYKGSPYEGGLRVPMIVRWPGHIAAGTQSVQVTYFADFLPTAAELAGTTATSSIDGISIVPTLLGEEAAGRKQAQHEYLYWELPRPRRLMQAVRFGDWKGLKNGTENPIELYNLANDIAESDDASAERPQIVAKIEELMRTARTEPRPQIEPTRSPPKPYQ